MSTLSCGHSPLIYRHLVHEFFIKTIKIMSRSTNAQRPYVYEALGSYISLVNNSIHIITPYWSKFINYLHQKIDLLIKDEFYPINTSNCEPIGFQTILCTP